VEDSSPIVVEDDAAHATLICDRPAPLASVEHAATQSAALRALEQQHYDTVVLDVGLPDGDGFEIQRRLSQRPEAPPIVFVTSDDLAENTVTALQPRGDRALRRNR
jgi:DNA-binding response OmpR family regulator